MGNGGTPAVTFALVVDTYALNVSVRPNRFFWENRLMHMHRVAAAVGAAMHVHWTFDLERRDRLTQRLTFAADNRERFLPEQMCRHSNQSREGTVHHGLRPQMVEHIHIGPKLKPGLHFHLNANSFGYVALFCDVYMDITTRTVLRSVHSDAHSDVFDFET